MGTQPTLDQIAWSQRAAWFYRRLGYNPLPSRSDKKAPALLSYTECHTRLLDERTLREWGDPEMGRYGVGNVQVVTGVKWDLAVVDCDGREGVMKYCDLMESHGTGFPEDDCGNWRPPWVVMSGGGGLHFWYSLPPDLLWLETRRLWGVWEPTGGDDWQGAWKKKAGIELLGDRRLIIAPPSIHPGTGKRYEWFYEFGPRDHPRPGVIPDWVLDLPAMVNPRKSTTAPRAVVAPASPRGHPLGEGYSRQAVLDAIPDKVAVARAWGLYVTGTPNAEGWIKCRAVSLTHVGDRTGDVNPSASFHAEKGIYMEMYPGGEAMSLFDLGVRCGRYPDWLACLNELGVRYRAPQGRE